MPRITIPAEDIRKGDTFTHQDVLYWTALEDATDWQVEQVAVKVQFLDGGVEPRFWARGTEIEIERP
jgi:hypothetical protein